MPNYRVIKILKIAKQFFEEVYNEVTIFIIDDNVDYKPQFGDVVIRPQSEEYKRILDRLKFKRAKSEIKEEIRRIRNHANSGRSFTSN